eukprot:NODE_2370_length_711_cov_53.223565_g1922_i0.p2 GENE.NODE_2370_length_711_cov_53.223565_g1922_i0~~NODE_2370_length_711_cov_53.223565_g1922_i0.p2  ORF type:complete len:211 (+),score=59.13 NODE_2370_length_711_cov_53.223565_g1922_i0:64-633(+)
MQKRARAPKRPNWKKVALILIPLQLVLLIVLTLYSTDAERMMKAKAQALRKTQQKSASNKNVPLQGSKGGKHGLTSPLKKGGREVEVLGDGLRRQAEGKSGTGAVASKGWKGKEEGVGKRQEDGKKMVMSVKENEKRREGEKGDQRNREGRGKGKRDREREGERRWQEERDRERKGERGQQGSCRERGW